jgi:hypothetical protein
MNESFIYTSMMQNVDLCDEIIGYHKDSPNKVIGETIKNVTFNGLKEKESTDVNLAFSGELYAAYTSQLGKVLDEYVEKYPWSCAFGSFGVNDTINVQHYAPTQGYHAWHTERFNHKSPNVSRHLVFMTYLNNVTEGGETEFFHQKLKLIPKKGLTVVWPADWTYVHRGIASQTQDKYIVTGWLNYLQADQ